MTLSNATLREQEVQNPQSYDWAEEAESYWKLLESENAPLRKAALHEKLGYSLYRASMQSGNAEEFRDRIRESDEAYRKARLLYWNGRLKAEAFRCQAMEEFLAYWSSTRLNQRKLHLAKAWRLAARSLDTFSRENEAVALGRTYIQLALTGEMWHILERNLKTRKLIAAQLFKYAEESVKQLSQSGTSEDIARACTIAAGAFGTVAYYSDLAARGRLLARSDECWKRAQQISEREALLEMAVHSRGSPVGSDIIGSDQAIETLEKAAAYARETGDRSVISSTLEFLAYNLSFKATSIEDLAESGSLFHRMKALSREAVELYSPISSGVPPQSLLAAYPAISEYLWHAAQLETDPAKKMEKLEMALEEAKGHLVLGESLGVDGLSTVKHTLSKVLASLARVEEDPERKRSLLQEAIRTRKESNELGQLIELQTNFWNRGMSDNYLADLEMDRAELLKGTQARSQILSRAVVLKERAIKLCGRDSYVLDWGGTGPSPYYQAFGRYQLECGDMYLKLFELSHNSMQIKKACDMFVAAAESFQKINLRGRTAEAFWKAATTVEKANSQVRASELYTLASNNYNIVAQKVPSLKKLYEELAFYMQAKSEIAKARHQHELKKYSEAKESYERAASFHTSSRLWSYLAPYYSAWANVENAEECAQQCQSEDSIQSFEESIRLFKETVRSIQSQLPLIEEEREQSAAKLVLVDSENWEKFSKARIIVEQARMADRTGDFSASWEACGTAINILQELLPSLPDGEPAQKDVTFLVKVCQAYQVLSKAETESTPESFAKAVKHFDSWQAGLSDAQARMLIMGHSHFYRALGLGVEFSQTGKNGLYTAAKRHCESASEYYEKAGLPESSEKSRATALLFDGYYYIGKAKRTPDPDKQARLYRAAEKLLTASSITFASAGYEDRKKQVTLLLEKTKKNQEIAVSLAEVLSGPTLVPLPDPPSELGPTNSAGIGPEEFATGRLEAEISVVRDTTNAEDIELKLVVANAGSSPATLLRVEGIVPTGFELKRIPDSCRVESNNLVLGSGKRLGPFQSQEFTLALRSWATTDVILAANIVSIDGKGKQHNHLLEPLHIAAKRTKDAYAVLTTSLNVPSVEFLIGESFDCTIAISAGSSPVVIEAIENCLSEGLEIAECEGGTFVPEQGRIDLRESSFEPGETRTVRLAFSGKMVGKVTLAPQLRLRERTGSPKLEPVQPVEITIHPSSPMLQFLTDAFVKDDSFRRLSLDQAGWRTLMSIATSLKIPRSQVYGEPRYGHAFGKPIETLLRAGLIEYRTFPGKGRGGNITKVRVVHDREAIRRLLDTMRPSTLTGTQSGQVEKLVSVPTSTGKN